MYHFSRLNICKLLSLRDPLSPKTRQKLPNERLSVCVPSVFTLKRCFKYLNCGFWNEIEWKQRLAKMQLAAWEFHFFFGRPSPHIELLAKTKNVNSRHAIQKERKYGWNKLLRGVNVLHIKMFIKCLISRKKNRSLEKHRGKKRFYGGSWRG